MVQSSLHFEHQVESGVTVPVGNECQEREEEEEMCPFGCSTGLKTKPV